MSMPYDIEAMAAEIRNFIADPNKVREYLLDEIRDIKKTLEMLCANDAKLTGEDLEAVLAHIPHARELLVLVTSMELVLADEVEQARIHIMGAYLELKS